MSELHHAAAPAASRDYKEIAEAIRKGLAAPAPPNHDAVMAADRRYPPAVRLLLLIAAAGGFWALIAAAFLALR